MNDSGQAFGVLLGTVAVFIAVMACLTIPNKTSKMLIGLFASLSIVGALGMYGYGFGVVYGEEEPLAAVFRAVFASLRIFGGSNAWDDVSVAFPVWWQQIFFWLFHMMGLFTTASAVLTTLGSGILRRVRLFCAREKNVSLIYGLNARTLEFGRSLTGKKNFVVFVDSSPDNALSQSANKMGALCRSDSAALQGSIAFLKGIGMRAGIGTIRLYALSRDQSADRRYARSLLKSLESLHVNADQTALTIRGPEDETENVFQNCDKNYGYGSVISVNEPELAARMLMQTYPPAKHMTFTPDGHADSAFHGVIVGFGQVGQAVLRQLVMNGQFYGSDFRVDVFDPQYEQIMGKLAYDCAPMLEHYDIRFHDHDGRSRQMYQFLNDHSKSLNYIVLCTGSVDQNTELSRQLSEFLTHRGCRASIYQCGKEGVSHSLDSEHMEVHSLYVPGLLCTDQIDRGAMAINHYYTRTGDMRSNWRDCSYFHRMSSRAAADFYDSLLHAAGTAAEAAKTHWAPEGALLENLARTEHLRWVAFHYCMGFRPMTAEEMKQRAQLLQQGKLSGKINQDLDLRLHACMIPWEQLDDLSRLQSELSGKSVDHKETDRNSIRTLADVLRVMDT